ncbi:MAG: hypothetical protein MUF51_05915 [Vicinamibacteria bacterium]|jgi:type VI secretion system protein ImpK|nr:hypothetical protein [Vicinamibacteria bacterium]
MADDTQGVLLELSLYRAAEFARTGDYAAAEELLTALGPIESGPPARLDLLARIHAQQGRFERAAALWQAAERQDPASAIYPAARRRAERRAKGGIAAHGSVMTTAVCLFLLVLGLFAYWHRRPSAAPVKAPSPQVANARPALREKPIPIQIGAVLGVTTRFDGFFNWIDFDDGLFDRGARLTLSGRARLTEIARAIDAHDKEIRVIELIGRTDDVPMPAGAMFVSNRVLAAARAATVLDHLRGVAHIDAARLRVLDEEEGQPPCAGDAAAIQRCHRTVSVRIVALRSL